MKITKRQLRRIIKEEYKKLLKERNDLIDDDGYENYLLSPRYITSDTMAPGDPDNLAEIIKQALRGSMDPQRGMDAVFDLYSILADGHPQISSNPKSIADLEDFLDYAIKEFGDMGAV